MIENTVFNNTKEIVNYVKDNYGLDINKVEKIDRGTANIYLLNTDRYILKEFQSKYAKEQIEKEVTVINHLLKHNIKVPEYLQTINKKYYCIYKNKVIIIQKFIKGYTLNNNEGNYEQVIECARYYGKIVKALETLPIKLPNADLSNWYSNESFERGLTSHEQLLEHLDINNKVDKKIKYDIEKKIKMIKEVRNWDYSDLEKVTVLNTHGDYNVLQFIYKNGKINAVIDFVSACEMPITWELIRSYSYIDKDAKNGEFNLENFVDYVKEFSKYIKLNEYDIKYLPYLYLIQTLTSTFGYKQYIQNRENIKLLEFGYFRTNVCEYLYKNLNKIVEKLTEEL